MLDLYDLFFGAGPAVSILMKLGLIPKDKDFKELTPSQYQKYYRDNDDTHEKVYALLPCDEEGTSEILKDNEVLVFTESDVENLKKAIQIVEKYCKDATYPLNSDEDKLRYTAARLPDVFSEGTKFSHSPMMTIKK